MADDIRYYYGELQRSYGRSRYRRAVVQRKPSDHKPLSPCNYQVGILGMR